MREVSPGFAAQNSRKSRIPSLSLRATCDPISPETEPVSSRKQKFRIGCSCSSLSIFETTFALQVGNNMTIKEGDKIPSVELHSGFPPKKVNMADYCKGNKVILLGLPGGKSQEYLCGVDEVLVFSHFWHRNMLMYSVFSSVSLKGMWMI